MLTTIRYVLLTAFRDWLILGVFLAVLLAVLVSSFLGATALVEQTQMALSYSAASSRIVLLVGLIVFVCFHVRRAFDNREIEVIISRPISRGAFVFAYWLGFVVVSMVLVVPLVGYLFFLTPAKEDGALYWGLSVMLEACLVVAFALFCSLILRSAVSSVLLSFSFYVISRMMGFFIYIIDKPKSYEGGVMNMNVITDGLLSFFSAVLPRLDLFGKTTWLVYGVQGDTSYLFFVPQSFIYIPLLLFMAAFDFKRRQF